MATSFAEFLGEWELYGFIDAAENRDTFEKLKDLRRAARNQETDLLMSAYRDRVLDEIARVYAVRWLDIGADENRVAVLGQALLEEKSVHIRMATAETLGRINLPQTLPFLAEALLVSRNPWLKSIVAYSFNLSNAVPTWKQKVDYLVDALEASGMYREDLDVPTAISAVRPSIETDGQDRFALTDYLIERTRSKRGRMIAVMASLILGSTDRNPDHALQRIILFEQQNQQALPAIKELRQEIYAGVLPAELKEEFERSYSIPHQEMMAEIRSRWRGTIRSSQANLVGRSIVGGLVAIGGGSVIWFSLDQVFSSTNPWPGIAGAIIGVLMLIIAGRLFGPVKDTRQALAEMGVATTAYAAFVQRSLAISNTYSRLFREERPSYTQLELSNKLMSEAMNDTVKALRSGSSAALTEMMDIFTET
jgi:hypothetical protein